MGRTTRPGILPDPKRVVEMGPEEGRSLSLPYVHVHVCLWNARPWSKVCATAGSLTEVRREEIEEKGRLRDGGNTMRALAKGNAKTSHLPPTYIVRHKPWNAETAEVVQKERKKYTGGSIHIDRFQARTVRQSYTNPTCALPPSPMPSSDGAKRPPSTLSLSRQAVQSKNTTATNAVRKSGRVDRMTLPWAARPTAYSAKA